jgi:hypothetical protein
MPGPSTQKSPAECFSASVALLQGCSEAAKNMGGAVLRPADGTTDQGTLSWPPQARAMQGPVRQRAQACARPLNIECFPVLADNIYQAPLVCA